MKKKLCGFCRKELPKNLNDNDYCPYCGENIGEGKYG